ncbi:glycosyltransferase family 2 protein [Haloferula sargassicola]|uniref:Glycosyltransferase 2-like domain-containing protein n=1 Tax=Haloferula sargassicola TaxID=490096 RepID=A0ABP9URM4_9BACT
MPDPTPSSIGGPPTVGVVIRFRDSAGTLPEVLRCLQAQTRRPDLLVGVDTGSSDGSAEIIRQAGGRVISWSEAYVHPRVLNFGVEHCPADFILALSSHTALDGPDTIERLADALARDPELCAVSSPWDGDNYYSCRITWRELQEKGLKFGGIYSNSMGMFRRACWGEFPFDPEQRECEDYAWAVAMLRRGYAVGRLRYPFRHLRQGGTRMDIFAPVAFRLARRHGLKVAWSGAVGTLRALVRHGWRWLRSPAGREQESHFIAAHWTKLRAWSSAAGKRD